MTDTSLNPGGSGFYNWFTNGTVRQQFVINSDVMGDLPVGTVVQVDPYGGPGDNPTTAVPTIQPSSTDSSVSVIGVVSAGTDLAGATEVPPGKVATVTCAGIARVLVDATTTAGQSLIQSPVTPGAAQTSSSPAGETLGVCLEDVTVISGTALAWAYIQIGSSGGGGGGGAVSSVAAADPSVVVGPNTGDVLVAGQSVEVTLNGVGPTQIQAIAGYNYNPSVGGGFILANLPQSLTGLAFEVTAMVTVAGDGSIVGYSYFYNNLLWTRDGTNATVGLVVQGLTLQFGGGIPTPSPGNTPNGMNAAEGMIFFTTTTGTDLGIWVCTADYDPVTPTNATWALISSTGGGGGVTDTGYGQFYANNATQGITLAQSFTAPGPLSGQPYVSPSTNYQSDLSPFNDTNAGDGFQVYFQNQIQPGLFDSIDFTGTLTIWDALGVNMMVCSFTLTAATDATASGVLNLSVIQTIGPDLSLSGGNTVVSASGGAYNVAISTLAQWD